MSDEAQDLEKLENELAEERQMLVQLNALIISPGWQILKAAMTSQERMRRNDIFRSPSKGLDGLIEQGKLISELSGVNTVMSMPQLLIDDSKMKLEGLLEMIRADDDELTDDDLDNLEQI